MDNLTLCEKCKTNIPNVVYDSNNKRCVCAAGFTRVDNLCLPCHYLCNSCTGLTNYDCEPYQCRNGGYPMIDNPKKCILNCESPTEKIFLDKIAKNCNCMLKH